MSFRLRASTDQPSFDLHQAEFETKKESLKSPGTLWGSIRNYSLLGFGAALLLAILELLDLNFTLTPIFQSFSERLLFGSYFCLNLIGGLILGLSLGIFVHTYLILKSLIEMGLARSTPRMIHKSVAVVIVSAFAAFILNQQ